MAKTKNDTAADAQVNVEPKSAGEAVQSSEPAAGQAQDLVQEVAAAKAASEALEAELEQARARIAELEALLEAGIAPGGVSGGETLMPAADFAVGSGEPAADADVVAIKSKHGHAFFRAGYRVLPDWTFVCRADFDPADFERLIGDRMVVVREALAKAAA